MTMSFPGRVATTCFSLGNAMNEIRYPANGMASVEERLASIEKNIDGLNESNRKMLTQVNKTHKEVCQCKKTLSALYKVHQKDALRILQ